MNLKNPEYVNLIKLGKRAWGVKKTVTLPELRSRTLPAPNKTTINLFPNQLPVYNYVKDKTSCLIEAKMSFGKTVLSIALHQAWGGRTLIAVHTLNMAHQFVDEFEKFIGVKPTLYCNGKKDISDITITTFTTLRKKYKEWDFDNVIIDEVDLFFSDRSIQAITDIQATRKIGMTGTAGTVYDTCNTLPNGVLPTFFGAYIKAKYDEGKNPLKVVYHHIYNKVYKEQDELVKPYEWHKFRSYLDSDIDRKKEQIKYIMDNYNNEPTLALFDRVADVDAFYEAGLKRGLTCYKNHGQLKKQEREDMLASFKKTGGVLFGQTSTLNRGYNNVALSRVFILYPMKRENTLRQIIGRVMRHMTEKESYVYLWTDSGLLFQFKKQKAIIKKYFGLDVC